MGKKVLSVTIGIFCAVSFLSFAGCSIQQEPITAADFNGEWTESDKSETYHRAAIQDGTIEIYWINDAEETRSIYWAGSFEIPDNPGKRFDVVSQNDTSKTNSVLLASTADEKIFSCTADTIKYEASALGTTWTVTMEKSVTSIRIVAISEMRF